LPAGGGGTIRSENTMPDGQKKTDNGEEQMDWFQKTVI